MMIAIMFRLPGYDVQQLMNWIVFGDTKKEFELPELVELNNLNKNKNEKQYGTQHRISNRQNKNNHR